jgi:hypothetical protein
MRKMSSVERDAKTIYDNLPLIVRLKAEYHEWLYRLGNAINRFFEDMGLV